MPDDLALADYRRRVAEMYLAPPTEGARGCATFRAARDRLFREHPMSALAPADRAAFTGLRYFDYDERYRVPARVRPPAAGDDLVIEMGGEDGAVRCRRAASLETGF